MNELATLDFGLQQLARLENELAGVSDLLVGIHHGTVGSGGPGGCGASETYLALAQRDEVDR